MGAGVLPVSIYKGDLYFLLGRERYNHLWCDFGGTPNKGERPFATALREGEEELNGFLGISKDFKREVETNMILSICCNNYTTYIFKTVYDANLPYYFKNTNKFIEKHLAQKIDNRHNGLFEKNEIKWFRVSELRRPEIRKAIRPHYIEIVNHIIKNKKFIIEEIAKI